MSAPAGAVQYGKKDEEKARKKKEKAGNLMNIAKTLDPQALAKLSKKDQNKVRIMSNVRNGEFSEYAKLSKYEQQELVNEKRPEIMDWLIRTATPAGQDRAQHIANVRAQTTKERINPVTRTAMSQIANEKDGTSPLRKEDRQIIHDMGEEMDKQVLIDTMKAVTPQQRQQLEQHYQNREDLKLSNQEYKAHPFMKPLFGRDKHGPLGTALHANKAPRLGDRAAELADNDIEKAKKQGEALLKTMFLMQLGNFQEHDDNGNSKEWEHNIANALSHGGRTTFTFSQRGENGDDTTMEDIVQAIFGTEESTGRHKRAAGTHHVVTKDKNPGKFEEEKGFGAEVSAMNDKQYKHYGMDMALGGVGQKGLNNQIIASDGRNSHMYIGRLENEKQQGALLLGLETDSPYHTNSAGHTHDMWATSAPTSGIGGLKSDLQGSNKGGRSVALNGLSNDELVRLLNGFTAYSNKLRDNQEDQTEYNALLEKMAGKRMDDVDLINILGPSFFGEDWDSSDATQQATINNILNRGRGRGRNM